MEREGGRKLIKKDECHIEWKMKKEKKGNCEDKVKLSVGRKKKRKKFIEMKKYLYRRKVLKYSEKENKIK